MANTGMMTACGLSLKFRAKMPRAYRDVKRGYNSGLKSLQVGRGVHKKLSDSEIAEASIAQASKPRRFTPLKIAL
jgi:hypothetical protein